MYKKTITYKDFNDVERTETYYFRLSETELTEWNMEENGGLANKLDIMVNSKDQAQIIKTLKEIIIRAYGEKSDDGRRLVKNNGELAKAFMETNAYDVFFKELCTSEATVSNFINGIIPKDLREEMNKASDKIEEAPAEQIID